jgi:hypothetical protein
VVTIVSGIQLVKNGHRSIYTSLRHYQSIEAEIT